LHALADGARHKVSEIRRGRATTVLCAVAASLLAVLATLWIVLTPAHRYDTAVGELRSVPLEDGSIVTLNTSSRIDVQFDENHRRIELLEGEALFQVAHDPNRPFDVIAGNATVRAVGTQFNVDLRPKRTVVTVVEGKVAVLSPDAAAAADTPGEGRSRTEHLQSMSDTRAQQEATYLSAGEQLTLEPRRAALPKLERPADVAVVTAWMQRQLVFDHRPIGEVAEEFNRYNELQIQIEGEALRNEQLTGVFKANDPESFLEFVGRMPGVRIERDTNNKRALAAL
jgi:transmembrane sensor